MHRSNDDILNTINLEHLMATIPSGFFLVNTDQIFVYWNKEAERITGYIASEVIGRHCSLLDGIECGTSCRLFDERTIKPVTGAICRVQSKDGRRLFILKNVDLVKDESGDVVGGIECFNDITELQQTQHNLEKALKGTEEAVLTRMRELDTEREWLRTVLDTMVDFAYICSDDYIITFMNRAMKEFFGDHQGEKCFQTINKRESVCTDCPLSEVKKGNVVRQERIFTAANMSYEVIHAPLIATDGTTQKLSVFRDITDRKIYERRLESNNRELDAFVYTVSHDLRSPLTPIIGYAELIEDQYRDILDEQALEMLSSIQDQGHRMTTLMEDLLTLSRVGILTTPTGPVNTNKIVREVILELSDLISEKETEVSINDLPEVIIPETLLSQMFSNLITNALRYGSATTKPIEVGGSITKRLIRFYVVDHGEGIKPEHFEQIFELFHRCKNHKGTPGTGLGLGIVRKIVDSLDGKIWVEETRGGGATFIIEIPN